MSDFRLKITFRVLIIFSVLIIGFIFGYIGRAKTVLDHDDFWAMMPFFGSLITAIVAMFAALYPTYKEYINRPMVWAYPAFSNHERDGEVITRSLKTCLMNNGKETARDVHMRIESVRQNNKMLTLSRPAVRSFGNIQRGDKREVELLFFQKDILGFKYVEFGLKVERNNFTMYATITGDNFDAFNIEVLYFDNDDFTKTQLAISRSQF